MEKASDETERQQLNEWNGHKGGQKVDGLNGKECVGGLGLAGLERRKKGSNGQLGFGFGVQRGHRQE